MQWPLRFNLGQCEVVHGPASRVFSILVFGTAAFTSCAAAVEPSRRGGWILELANPSISRLQRQRANIDKELARIPNLEVSGAQFSRGYHSANLPCRDCPTHIIVDLGEPAGIDAVALFPAQPLAGGVAMNGYGFPVRFRIEAALKPDFGETRLLADESRQDYSVMGLFPYYVSFPTVQARYVRLTVLRHSSRSPGLYIVALAEMMVFERGTNVALERPVSVSVDSQISLRWAPEYLVDGRTPVSMAVGRIRSPSNGYHSLITSRQDVVKWFQVDLEGVTAIDEIVLVPAHPVDWLDAPGFGFPLRFRLEGSRHHDMSRPVLLGDYSRSDFDNPGDNPVVVRTPGAQVRYIRLTATRLYAARERALLAMAEMQVFSRDRNVALGKPVEALDSLHFAPRPLWDPAFLTDGYSSDYNLIPMREWLGYMQRRRKLEQDADALNALLAEGMEAAVTRLTAAIVALITAAGGVVIIAVFRSRRLRGRQMRRVREQIARDLHDEVGSNLASISLISGAGEPGEPASDLRRDLQEVHRIAVETNEALRDIVWLLHMDRTSAADLVERMRSVAHRLLKSTAHTFTVSPEPAAPELTLPMWKNTLRAFKEALTNVVRHSHSTEVAITVAAGPQRFLFAILDNGVGFSHDVELHGDGLRNMESRARELNGEVRIRTAPGSGTCVEFEFPTRTQKRDRGNSHD